jgi:hypothetical protein
MNFLKLIEMTITAKFKLIGENLRVGKIISNFAAYAWSVVEQNQGYQIIEVEMPNAKGLNELKRRLSSKRRRKVQLVELGGTKEGLSDRDERMHKQINI